MWRVEKKEKKNETKLSFKYSIYPTIEAEEKLLRAMLVEAKAYNILLDVVNKARKEGKKITPKDTQDILKNFKVEGKELVYSKALQMMNNQLWYKYQCSCP